jgi:hypothetical protein
MKAEQDMVAENMPISVERQRRSKVNGIEASKR